MAHLISDNLKVTGVVLLGNLSTAQKLAQAEVVNGAIVYDTDLNKLQGYENGSWVDLVQDDIGDMANVTLTTPAEGQALVWRTDKFVNEALPSGATTIGALNDVDLTGITAGQILEWDGAKFIAADDDAGTTITSLNSIGGVDTATNAPVNGDQLVFDGTNWVPKAPTAPVTELYSATFAVGDWTVAGGISTLTIAQATHGIAFTAPRVFNVTVATSTGEEMGIRRVTSQTNGDVIISTASPAFAGLVSIQ